MSAANAAARKRRAAPEPAPSVVNRPGQFGSQSNQPSAPTSSAGLTLQQVISLIDTRLIKLETFMKESSKSTDQKIQSPVNKELEITNNDVIMQEIDRRFEFLAEETNNLKDMLLKLQSYTMEVNKTLMEERVRVFSDLGSVDNNVPTFSENIFQETATLDLKDLAESEFSQ